MISSAQTVAKTGRRIKKSTNKLNPLSLSFLVSATLAAHHGPLGAQDRQRVQAPIGRTGMPLTRNCVLDTITLSPALSPEAME